MNALTLYGDWRDLGFSFEALGAHCGFVGHDGAAARTMLVVGDELGVQQAELGISFLRRETHEHSMRLLAIFLGTFFPAWTDGGRWLEITLRNLGRGQVVAPVKRDGYTLRLTHSGATGLLVARVEASGR